MRDYGKVYCSFWADPSSRGLSDNGKLLALYLLTCPHGNQIGLFRLPDAYAADDLGWELARVQEAFRELVSAGFVSREQSTAWLVLPNFMRWNPFENPNVAKGAEKLFDQCPEGPSKTACAKGILEHCGHLSEGFRNRLERVSERVYETVSETLSEGFSKGFRNQEPNQSLTRTDQEPELGLTPFVPPEDGTAKVILEIFEHWRTVMKHPKAALDDTRKKIIRRALKSYSADQLKLAITGCSRTPHNMGHNDRGERYDDLGLILRDAAHIDRFARNAKNSPILGVGAASEFADMGKFV